MNYQEFIDSLKSNECPQQLDPCLRALWYEASGDWHTAHEIVQQLDSAGAARVHAYLHRKQGDIWNSKYWHRRAGTSFPENMSPEQEWKCLVTSYLD